MTDQNIKPLKLNSYLIVRAHAESHTQCNEALFFLTLEVYIISDSEFVCHTH